MNIWPALSTSTEQTKRVPLHQIFEDAQIVFRDFLRSDPPSYFEMLDRDPSWLKDLFRTANEHIDNERKKLAFETVKLAYRFRER